MRNNLIEYRDYFQNVYPRRYVSEIGFRAVVILTIFFILVFYKFIPPGQFPRYALIITLASCLVYANLMHCPSDNTMTIEKTKNETTLVVKNHRLKGRKFVPMSLFANVAVQSIFMTFNPVFDPYYRITKNFGCYYFNSCAEEVQLRLPGNGDLQGKTPRRNIIITNHTISPSRDAFAFFPLIPTNRKMMVIQHNFNSIVTSVARKTWGAWTMDKDDKTPEGKAKLLSEMEKILKYIRNCPEDLTVVIFPGGVVPKTVQDSRSIKKFYPGAFYLSLLSGYWITPLINDYSPATNTFRTIVKEPVNLAEEYRGRFVGGFDTVKDFRENETNKNLLEEICERFRRVFNEETSAITKIEQEQLEKEDGRPSD